LRRLRPVTGGKARGTMDSGNERNWGERLADEGASSAGDEHSARNLVIDAMKVVRGRLGDIRRHGIQPLLDEAAAQVRPATLTELRARYPGLADDQIAHRLIERAARTAAGVALGIGGLLVAQEALAAVSAAVPPAGGGFLGAVGITALAEVLVLFVLEAKLRADLGALAGQPALSPSDLVSGIVSEVQASGGWRNLRGGSLRSALPEAAARRIAVQVARLVPGRFARIVIPEVVAPLIGSVFAARMALRQVRAAGEAYWAQLRPAPRTTATWGMPTMTPGPGHDGGNGGRRRGSHPSTWGPDPGGGSRRQELPPPEPPAGG
jgi:hypothetical protein